MTVGSVIFLLLLVGAVFWMFSMHRGGGHAHGMGGGGGHGHGHGSSHDDQRTDDESRENQREALAGSNGAKDAGAAPAPAAGRRHRGC